MRIAFSVDIANVERMAVTAARLRPLFDLAHATAAAVSRDPDGAERVVVQVAGRYYYGVGFGPQMQLSCRRITDPGLIAECQAALSGPAVHDTETLCTGAGGGAWLDGSRCPRCNCTLLTDGQQVWCSFVGGEGQAPCSFGLDKFVTVAAYSADPSAQHRQEKAP